jgi:hypothetical protein
VTGYDIIGDVHGCADKLATLLKELGYAHSDGAYRHPEQRQVVFVGDLIDRGPLQLESVAIPRAMVEHGTAQMIIGNHEFNAVAFATRNADNTDWCRPHTTKNRSQHEDFIKAAGFGSVAHRSILNWFMSLPLWLDLDGLTDELVRDATTKGMASYDAIKTVLKGPEIEMEGYSYADKDGHKRTDGRAEWWNTGATSLRDIIRVDPSWTLTDADAPPVLFGHYWFADNDLKPSTPTTACVDFSAVKGGDLVAYRWNGESTLTSDNFVAG